MKKILLLVTAFSLSLILLMVPKVHAYTLTSLFIYNQTTSTNGQSDLLDIGSTYIEYMYFNLDGTWSIENNDMIRLVFSNSIPTTPLPTIALTGTVIIEINFYDSSHNLLLSNMSYFGTSLSFSYYENNIRPQNIIIGLDYITIKISNLPIGYDEEILHQILQGAIIGRGIYQIIHQPIDSVAYTSGWDDAMGSKVTQIWSLWGNIFDTFMSVFDIFSIQLMGDITIGHIAMVPLVLGLIGFIYALGGKRGR